MAQAWYQGGISVFDWTDPSHPREIAYFDRGPMDSTKLVGAGSWSAYWYNGYIISSEISRGLDILELQPSALLSQNEIDAAKLIHFDYLNAQDQQKLVWPASFVVARAYLDQLARSNGLASARVAATRDALGRAEKLVGRQRRDALTQLATQLSGDAQGAADAAKDQTYMLARLDPRRLDRLWFPLGGWTKEETRARAREAGLAAAARAESQEACFLAGGDYRHFLERHGLAQEDGPIVDESGRELGRHDGFWRFTRGQRRGLGVATGQPLYALETRPRTNTVVVGPRESLARTVVGVPSGRLFVPVERAEAKLRYQSPGTPARVEPEDRGFRLSLDRPAFGVAPGQAAVLYEDDAVVGAGLIASAA